MATSTAAIQIQRRLVSALQSPPALAGGNVRSNRHAPLGQRETQALRVWLVQSEPQGRPLIGAGQDWITTFRIDCLARALDADTDPADAADALLQAAYSRAAAVQPDDLGVLDINVAVRLTWDFEEADTPVGAVGFFVQVNHRTGHADLQPAT